MGKKSSQLNFQISTMLFLALIVALAVPAQMVHAATSIYVNPNGCGSNSPCYPTIQEGVDAAADGDTIYVAAATYVLGTAVVSMDTANVTLVGVGNPLIQVSGTGERFMITAAGNTIQGFTIEKTDKTGVQNIIYIGANNTTVQNNVIFGHFVIGEGDVSRAMVFTGGLSGVTITGNTIYDLRQPAYISGPTTGTISNNLVYRTKGWVVEQGDMTFTNNTWGTGADANVYDIAILSSVNPSYYTDIPAMAAANHHAFIEDQRTTPATLSNVYVDASVAVSGDGTARSPKKTINEGITRVVRGGTVNVYPGYYQEAAPNSRVLNGSTYTFGLFVSAAKSGITVQGIHADGSPITTSDDPVIPEVETFATDNFGPDGVYVEGDHVTLSGFKIWQNFDAMGGLNKTVTVNGNAFTIKACHLIVAPPEVNIPADERSGSLYLNDERFDTINQVSHVQSYIIDGNWLEDVSIDINSGAGFSGPVSGRVIQNNRIDVMGGTYASISFTGKNTGVPWFVNGVGGALIVNNHFQNGAQYIRARGDYDNDQFDWTAYWNNNTFDRAAIVGVNPLIALREYSYAGSYGPMLHVRRIGALIQGEIDNAQPGDTVLVKAGTYPESPNVSRSVTLRSESGRDLTTIALQHGPTYLGSLTIDAAEVTIDGFTITGFDATETTLASSNIVVTTNPDKVSILNNRLLVGNVGANTNQDDGIGLVTYYAVNPSLSNDVAELLVQGNLFAPLTGTGYRAFYINPGVDKYTFRQNSISGSFSGRAITQARNGLVEENTLTGTGDSGGFGTWGYPTPAVYGKTTFRNNLISGTGKGISVISTENVVVTNNDLHDNAIGVWVGESTDPVLPFNGSTVQIHQNSITGSSGDALTNETAGSVNASANWWGGMHGPVATGNPLGDGGEINGAVLFDPWLCDGTDTNTTLIGFQPGSVMCTNLAARLVFKTQPSNGIAGVALPIQPVVRVEGANGELVINYPDTVTLLMANNPGGAILSGQTSVYAADGIAAFSSLSLNKVANNYSLFALAGSLTKTSAFFNILPFEANLAITHSSMPPVVAPKDTWSLTLSVTNGGPADAANLSLTDTLPGGVTFVSAAGTSWTCSQALDIVHCTLPTLAAGSSSPVTITLKAPAALGQLTNEASVTSDVIDPVSTNNTTSASTTVVGVPVTGLFYYLPAITQH